MAFPRRIYSLQFKKFPDAMRRGTFCIFRLFFVAFGGIEAIEVFLAGGANEVAGVAGLIEADL